MCFRPADASIGMNKCPECGKINKPIDKVCAQCGAELNPEAPPQAGQAPDPIKPKGPGAPGAPKAPNTPKVPGAPDAPK